MEDSQGKRGWIARNRKPIAVIILLIIIPQFVVYSINLANRMYRDAHPELDPYYEPEYNLTVWIAPEDEEFTLHVDIYASEQDAYSRVNRYHGYGIRVEPLDDEKNDLHLYTVPEGLLNVWVKIYFNYDTQEPFIILRLDIEQKITTTLVGREISLLMEPLLGDEE
ncbi:MAG: hypothetical protein RTV31_13655 [Candidatus Thorarchaeota archaeon]